MKVKFEVKHKSDDIVIIEFALLQESITPQDLKEITPPNLFTEGLSRKIIVLSGRGPIWLYGYLIHYYHPVRAIAVYDPRIGAVIVASHHPDHRPGDVIEV